MKDELNPPFKKGQKVYKAEATHVERKVPCSDCGGKKEITYLAADPVEEVTVPCPVCRSGWEVTGYLTYWDIEPNVVELTVMGFRYDSTDDEPWTYMMVGYWSGGGGQLFSKTDLFETREEAEARAKVIADERREDKEREIIEQKYLRRKDVRRRDEDGLRLSMTAQIRRMRDVIEYYTGDAHDGGAKAREVLAQNAKAPYRSN